MASGPDRNNGAFESSLNAAYESVFRALEGRPPDAAKGEAVNRREAFYFEVAAGLGVLESGRSALDLGAGMSWFGSIASELGLTVSVVDDYGGGGGVDIANRKASLETLDAFRRNFGVSIYEQDLLVDPLPLSDDSIDIVTCFHSLEHWHHSPKKLFSEIRRVLRPGGYLFIATPNVVNLRKRIHVLLGRTNLSELTEWYDEPVFRGHVREPTVGDLHTLMSWNEFEIVSTFGRNFIGEDSIVLTRSFGRLAGLVAKISEPVLKRFPTLCSDIHVVGRKT